VSAGLLAAGVLAAAAALAHQAQAAALPEPAPLTWPVTASLVVMGLCLFASVVTDLKWRLIRDVVTAPALLLELLLLGHAGGPAQLHSSLLGMAALFVPLFLASLPRRPLVGEGDAKLMAVVGAEAGWPSALLVLFWVSVAGGVQALLAIAWARLRGEERPEYVPYGVAIAAGAALAWVVGWP
jgi:prepilin signal peptidase PulO-like enzyme (type II secretory pathway)